MLELKRDDLSVFFSGRFTSRERAAVIHRSKCLLNSCYSGLQFDPKKNGKDMSSETSISFHLSAWRHIPEVSRESHGREY
jgi:hypothetical protein